MRWIKLNQQFFNGTTTFGTALALIGLSKLYSEGSWQQWGMIVSGVIFLILSFIAFFQRNN